MSRIVNGIKHRGGCACPVCDPGQDIVRAQRARAIREAQNTTPVVAAARPSAAFARPARRPYVPADDTRRLAALLKSGKTFAQAAVIIEAEKAQRKDPTPWPPT